MLNVFIRQSVLLGAICLFSYLLCANAYAQNAYNFRQINTQVGLSSNEINAIIEDKNGLMWFATPDGLNKYDGTNVTVYRHEPENAGSLPGNEVYALYTDKLSKLWIGTSNGLCYYDSQMNRFVSHKAFVNIPVRSICSDHEGNLWVGSYGDLKVINVKTGKVNTIKTPGEASKQERVWCILSLFEDNQKRMWIGSQVGAYRYDFATGRMQSFLHKDANPSSISNNYVTAVTQDKAGRIWLGTLNGLNRFIDEEQKFNPVNIAGTKSDNQHGNIIHTFSNQQSNKLWIGTEDGLRIFDTQTLNVSTVTPDFRNVFSLKNNLVKTLYKSAGGILWVGLEHGGVNTLDDKLSLFNYEPGSAFEMRGSSLPVVTSFAQINNNEFFVGTIGGGLQLFNKQKRTFKAHLFNRENVTPLSVLSLKKSGKGDLWVGTYENGLFKYNLKTGKQDHYITKKDAYSISENVIYCIEEDHTGKIWIGTNGKGIKIFDPVSNAFIASYGKQEENQTGPILPLNGFIRAIAEDVNHDVWIGSYGSGLAVYHPQTKNFKSFMRGNSNLVNNHVLSILHDSKARTWIGTNGGLCLFDKQTQKFISYAENESLLKRMVFKILEDGAGYLWLSTDKGIIRFNPVTRSTKVYTADNGVLNSPFFVGSGLFTSTGEMFFGGEFGFNYFTPKALPPDRSISPVILTGLKVANNTIQPGKNSPINVQVNFAKTINLKHGQNFSLSFVAINYGNPSQTKYTYKLEGFDKGWNLAGNSKTAQYTNLDPGTYTFKVKAGNAEGLWSNSFKSVIIVVSPPWWRTGWAYFAYFAVCFAALYIHRLNSIRKIKLGFELEKEKLKARELVEIEKRETHRLRELDAMKIKFLTNISHEFRTPITLILTPVEQMLSQLTDAAQLHQAKVVQRNARRLLNLVNQLLDFRKLEEQELKLNLNPGDLVEFITQAADAFHDLAEHKKIRFTIVNKVAALPAFFDADKVERILFNLLSNAFKFTEEGGEVAVHTSLQDNSGADSMLMIKISDTGIGIPLEQQSRIFERFFQHSASQASNKGSGIGLSITKEFINLHGGQIEVDSEQGRGTVFSFTLPVIPTQTIDVLSKTATDVVEKTVEDEALVKVTEGLPVVLIVDDNDDIRFYLKDNLKAYYKILEATNGKEGWQKALSYHPQLVVSDITMPGMNGIELTQKITADKRTCHIPVILLTALTGEDEHIKGLQAGASDYLTKPFNFELLHVKIKNLLSLNQSLKNTYSRQINVVSSPVEVVSEKVKFLSNVVLYIEKNINNPELNVADLSNQIGVSRGTLYRKILDYTGQKPVEYIRGIKLEKAAQLLEKSDLNVSQIAYMTGFATPTYFSRMFKAKYDVVPSEYITLKRAATVHK